MIGLRAGTLFGVSSCLSAVDGLKKISGWLQAGAQQSKALDQTIEVLTGAAGQPPLEDTSSQAAEDKKSPEQADKKTDPEQADGSPEHLGSSPSEQMVSPEQGGAPPSGQAAVAPGAPA